MAGSAALAADEAARSAKAAAAPTVIFMRLLLFIAASAAFSSPSFELIDPNGEDENRAGRHGLPERWNTEDDKTIQKHDRDEHADHGSSDAADPAEQARAAEHDGGNRRQIVHGVAADRGRCEARGRHHGREPGER